MVTRRAELGQWFTAPPVARLAIAALGGIAGARVIDPTCGDGAFLAAARAAGARQVVGIEIDPDAAHRAGIAMGIEIDANTAHRAGIAMGIEIDADAAHRARVGIETSADDDRAPGLVESDSDVLAPGLVESDSDVLAPGLVESDSDVLAPGLVERESQVIVSDVLAPGLVKRLGLFDVAIGNPPYVRAGRVDPALKRERARILAEDWPELDTALVETIARHADVSATYLLRALRFVRPGGRLALVVSTALLDADGAAAVWTAVRRVAVVEALIAAPGERWFADAAVNSMLLVARRAPSVRTSPRIVRLTAPTRDVVDRATSLDDIARASDERHVSDAAGAGAGATAGVGVGAGAGAHTDVHRADDVSTWGPALRAPSVWFAWRDRAREHLVPLRELVEVRRGLTTGANDVFYVRREEARRLRLEPRFLAPVVRSPFNGAPAPIAIAPDESPLVAIAVPPDAKLARAPRIAAWFARHEAATLATSAARRDPWWSLPVHPARLFFAKAYGPRFVQRLADTPMLADQRVYALHPREGVDLVALAAVLNALPTALALESLGRGSMGYGAVEWTVHDALELPVLDVRRATEPVIAELHAALAAIARRPIGHVRLERDEADRARLDRAVLAMAPGGELVDAIWDGLCASVAQRDRYLLPAV